jgi:hypothetical protein
MRFIQMISDQWRSRKLVRTGVIVALVVFLVAFLYPWETTVIPQWNVRVVDDDGAVVREINVTEHWQNYLLESEGHEEAKTTNEDGEVSFAARNIRAGVARRLFAWITKLGNPGNPSRPIRYGSLVVWGSRSYETTVAVYAGEGSPQTEVRVQRLR